MTNITKREIQFFTNYWCKTKGFSSRDLIKHKQIDDLILLINIRDELWQSFNPKEQAIWQTYWNKTYGENKKLTFKSLSKLEQITITATGRKQRENILRQKIKQLRQNPYSKSADDMTAKDADTAYTASWV